MTIKTVRNILRAQMYISLALTLAIIILFETETLLPGMVEKGSQAEFLIVTIMEIATVCIIPLALRLFKFKTVERELTASPVSALQKWGVVRMALICDTMTLNTLLYYITPLDVALGYMAIICFICLIFVNPTMRRCLAETNTTEDDPQQNA